MGINNLYRCTYRALPEVIDQINKDELEIRYISYNQDCKCYVIIAVKVGKMKEFGTTETTLDYKHLESISNVHRAGLGIKGMSKPTTEWKEDSDTSLAAMVDNQVMMTDTMMALNSSLEDMDKSL